MVKVHHPRGAGEKGVGAGAGGEDEVLRRLKAGEALADSMGADGVGVEEVIGRVMGVYPFEAMARQPAVQTVSELKSRVEEDGGKGCRWFRWRGVGERI